MLGRALWRKKELIPFYAQNQTKSAQFYQSEPNLNSASSKTEVVKGRTGVLVDLRTIAW